MRFVAIDVETANSDMLAICALGAVEFDGSEQRNEFCSIIDPVDFLDSINVGIHGISRIPLFLLSLV
jgi:DNA polymerase-3 subunit epsilon